MGQKQIDYTVAVSMRLAKQVSEKLEHEAQKLGVKKSALVTFALKKYFDEEERHAK
jgi:predicted DNA-binding protein